MRLLRAATLTLAATLALAQQTSTSVPPDLRFDVVSLKATPPGAQGGRIRPAPGGRRYVGNNINLRLMIAVAYGVKADQIVGGPDWAGTVGYELNAQAERPSEIDELHVMLQNVLKDSFKLQFHRETRELPIYSLTVDKGGHKLKPHPFENAGEPWIDQKVEQVTRMTLTARSVKMNYFAFRLSQLLDRPAVDQTNLPGDFDFVLTYTRELPPNIREGAVINGNPVDTSGPNIFAAMPQQLGLKLEPKKGPVSVFLIDHAEQPPVN